MKSEAEWLGGKEQGLGVGCPHAPSRHGPSCRQPRGPITSTQQQRGCSQLPGAAVSAEAPEGSRRSLTTVAIGHRSDPAWRPGLRSTLSTAQGGPWDTVPEGVGEEHIVPSRWLKYKVTTSCTVLLWRYFWRLRGGGPRAPTYAWPKPRRED